MSKDLLRYSIDLSYCPNSQSETPINQYGIKSDASASIASFDFGPLGEKNVLSVKNFLGFSEDGKSLSFEVELLPSKRYQIVLNERFRNLDGVLMKPYLIDVKTNPQ